MNNSNAGGGVIRRRVGRLPLPHESTGGERPTEAVVDEDTERTEAWNNNDRNNSNNNTNNSSNRSAANANSRRFFRRRRGGSFSRWYCWLSAAGAALAVLTAAPPESASHAATLPPLVVLEEYKVAVSPPPSSAHTAAVLTPSSSATANDDTDPSTSSPSLWDTLSPWNVVSKLLFVAAPALSEPPPPPPEFPAPLPPIWLRWLHKEKPTPPPPPPPAPPVSHSLWSRLTQQQPPQPAPSQPGTANAKASTSSRRPGSGNSGHRPTTTTNPSRYASFYSWTYCGDWIDPTLLSPSHHTLTDLIDKVLTSTTRLLLIANWLMALTVVLHTVVADWFLGPSSSYNNTARGGTRGGSSGNNNNNNHRTHNHQTNNATTNTNTTSTTNNSGGSGREQRMGGFLVFKLLLVSAVVAPDTLDLLILLSWYTVLSFLRSLSCMAAHQTELARWQNQQHQAPPSWYSMTATSSNYTNNNTSRTSHFNSTTPAPGVWHLLATVLCLDLAAATVCVYLFHAAGTGMVLLLTCDCALLAVELVTNMLQHVQLVREVRHAEALQAHEESSVLALQQLQQGRSNHGDPVRGDDDDDRSNGAATQEQSLLDQQMELSEQQHLRQCTLLDSSVFTLQLVTEVLTVAHFLHIWYLHGVQLTLIDGVLFLHLHSAVTSATKKIAQRRTMYRISRDMDGVFDDATELDLKQASAAGDVCCICLGTMTYLGTTSSSHHNGPSSQRSNAVGSANVKKVACGHLYHTACLREVVERAQSTDDAKCPLCRSYVSKTRYAATCPIANAASSPVVVAPTATASTPPVPQQASTNNVAARTATAATSMARGGDTGDDTLDDDGEHALFRFSTEGMFPVWLPLPAFSFEVVRRPANATNTNNNMATANPAATGPTVELDEREAAVLASMDQIGDTRPAVNGENIDAVNNADIDVGNIDNDVVDGSPRQANSFFRRLMQVAGTLLVPMTPEQERAALEQLVDMFPQYGRPDLLGALRERGSAEAVAESILLGVFTGSPTAR